MSASIVSVRNKYGIELEQFDDMRGALNYIHSHALAADCPCPDLPENAGITDEYLRLGHLLRTGLSGAWRHRQFDRLLQGEIRALPDFDGLSLELESVLAAQDALVNMGISEWEAETGRIETRKGIVVHAWLRDQDGRVLDFMADRLGGETIQVLSPAEALETGYNPRPDMVNIFSQKWSEDLEVLLSGYVKKEMSYDMSPG